MVTPQGQAPTSAAMESTPKKLAPRQLDFAAAAAAGTAAAARPEIQLPAAQSQQQARPGMGKNVLRSNLPAPRPAVKNVAVVKAEAPSQQMQTNHVQRDDVSGQMQTNHIQRDEMSRQMQTNHIQRDDVSRQMQTNHIQRDDVSRQMQTNHIQRDDVSRQMQTNHIRRDDVSRQMQTNHIQRDDVSRQRQTNHIQRDDVSRQRQTNHIQRDDVSRQMQTNHIQRDGVSRKPKHCNCKNSRCLKLYCECFASGTYCNGCNCSNCHNNVEHEKVRQDAVQTTLERNPEAFRPKIANSPRKSQETKGESSQTSVLGKHNRGCNCKKSSCLKKYCECFQANILCSENCKCLDCKNCEGSEERRALLHGNQFNTGTHMHQATNAAISGAIGASGFGSPPLSKKRKQQEVQFGTAANNNKVYRVPMSTQENQSKSAITRPSSSSPNTAAFGSSKVTYRSPLAGILKTEDVKNLCSLLVNVSAQAAQTFAAKEHKVDQQQPPEESQTTAIVPYQESPNGEAEADCCASTSGEVMRPTSPSTLALMCDEEATAFTEAGPSNDEVGSHGGNPAPGLANTELYAEQERRVLTAFRDCLNRIITCGSIRETMCSPAPVRDFMHEARHSLAPKPNKPPRPEKAQTSNGTINPLVQAANEAAHHMASGGPRGGLPPRPEPPSQNGTQKPKTEQDSWRN